MARIGAVILAAGKGTRLKTELPKVLHEVCGRPMLAHVFDACRDAGIQTCVGVIGYGKEKVRETFADETDLQWVEQNEQLGTGHAVMMAREWLPKFDHVVVLCGDGPLIRAETIRGLIETHQKENAAATLATAELDDPFGYGRIWRDASGQFLGIVEHNDATEEQKRIREINPSYYCFNAQKLAAALPQLKPNNAKNEYYITDVFGMFLNQGDKVVAITSVPPEDIFSINSRADLALVNRVMRDRTNRLLMENGVTIVDPTTTWIDARARIGQDSIIYPNTYIQGRATIGRGCRIGPSAVIGGPVTVADGATVRPFQELTSEGRR
jgi:bifunctional UDP-N-acetylglucosamine pyrophosphorylase/glucosamine-1-phosphate N-acetyltransferase